MPRKPSLDNTPSPPTEALLAQAMASVTNAIFITDELGRIVWVNDAFVRLSGYSAAESMGRTPAMLRSGRQGPSFYRQLWQTILSGESWQGEIVDRKKDGTLYTADEVITPLLDGNGAVRHFVAIQHDVTQRKQEQDQEHYLAYHDVITGLPNRALFAGVLRNAVAHAKRTRQLAGILFLDLDRFKPVNDKFGHHMGDRLLAAVAERLRTGVRQTDTVARIGGDEFAIIAMELSGRDSAAKLAANLLDAISRPFVLHGQLIRIGLSIGIALYPLDGDDPETLLQRADQAMYRAKSQGSSGYCFHGSPEPQPGGAGSR